MGLFDWLQRKSNPDDSPVSGKATFRVTTGTSADGALPSTIVPKQFSTAVPTLDAQLARHGDARWIPPGEHIRIQGFEITSGMIYVGRRLVTRWGTTEPALIDPELKIDSKRPEPTSSYFTYWMSYSSLSTEARAGFLKWLAGGRRDPNAAMSSIVLFICGLERRVFVDIANDARLQPELNDIRREMTQLRDIYLGPHNYVRHPAARFIEILDFLIAGGNPSTEAGPPALVSDSWEVPLALQLGLGRFAMEKEPLPADWAFAWIWYLPNFSLRTPAVRCTAKFQQLFSIRYRETFGDGLKIRRAKASVTMSYSAMNQSIGYVHWNTGTVPNVFPLKAPTRKLILLFDDVTAELDLYSRWLGRNPGTENTLTAASHLPPVLQATANKAVRRLRAWAKEKTSSAQAVRITGQEFLRLWSKAADAGFSKTEAARAAQLLASLGYGIEPDVRFYGPPIAGSDTVVLFKVNDGAAHELTPGYDTATMIVRLAAAVSAVDGQVSWREMDRLGEYLESALDLEMDEKRRLHAHIMLLSTAEITFIGLRRRIDPLTVPQREAIGDLVVAIAVADGTVSPAEITMLQKIFRLLILDPKSVTSRIHATLTGIRPHSDGGPVVVRQAKPAEPGTRIPGRLEKTSGDPIPFLLDTRAIRAKMEETAAVAGLLGDLFREDEQAAPPLREINPALTGLGPQVDSGSTPLIAGLDVPHSRLVLTLIERDRWTRVEFEELADSLDLMPDGAIDMLNEAAIEASEEPLIEGTDLLVLNQYAMEELTR